MVMTKVAVLRDKAGASSTRSSSAFPPEKPTSRISSACCWNSEALEAALLHLADLANSELTCAVGVFVGVNIDDYAKYPLQSSALAVGAHHALTGISAVSSRTASRTFSVCVAPA
ncbi:hypothetical protein ACFSL4_34575 [Streptomyces caeni]|uniref:Uncharacterized protein n=1 Tax=Streptomyces caeni TaxID=2307231 RepID=A0ABW4J208_9ACTN